MDLCRPFLKQVFQSIPKLSGIANTIIDHWETYLKSPPE